MLTSEGEELDGADPETFQSLEPTDVLYAKDKNAVYRENKKIAGFDPISFRVVLAKSLSSTTIYLVDRQKVSMEVWFDGDQVKEEQIVNADPETFEAMAVWWSKDKENVFYKTQSLKGADSATFQVLGGEGTWYIGDQVVYGKDKDNVYFLSSRISSADVASFEQVVEVKLPITLNAYGRDKNNAYLGAEVFPKGDLNSLIEGKIPASAKYLGNNKYLYLGKTYLYSKGGQEPPNLSQVPSL